MEDAPSPSWFSKLFAPKTNFYALLDKQSKTTLKGVEALKDWIDQGTPGRGQRVRDLEHEADKIVLDLLERLVDSFITPFDREDIYDLSARLDEVINAAKTTVREIEALEVSTQDYFLKEMVSTLVEGTRCLTQSFSFMERDLQSASQEAQLARQSENRVVRLLTGATMAIGIISLAPGIVKRVGSGIFRIQPVHALSSQLASASIILAGSATGAPLAAS